MQNFQTFYFFILFILSGVFWTLLFVGGRYLFDKTITPRARRAGVITTAIPLVTCGIILYALLSLLSGGFDALKPALTTGNSVSAPVPSTAVEVAGVARVDEEATESAAEEAAETAAEEAAEEAEEAEKGTPGSPNRDEESDEKEGINVSLAEEGEKLYKTKGCAACHRITGEALIGPNWGGLYGSKTTFTDGTSLIVDEDYLRESILEPSKKIVEGFDSVPMTQFQLTGAEVFALVEYIKSLK